jgi:hypothetical protein
LKFVPGYVRDEPKKRARAKSSRLLLGASPNFPVACDNRSKERVQEDQGPTGSCGGHGTSQRLQVAGAVQGVQWLVDNVVSPGDVYRMTRCLERVPNLDGSLPPLSDTGIMPADLAFELSHWGTRAFSGTVTDPDGTVRVSDVTAANLVDEPVLADLEADATHAMIGQYRIDEGAGDALAQTFAAIASQGAVGLGIFVDSAFQGWDPSQPPLDSVNLIDPSGGGHWLTADYYDSNAGTIGLWNSWGAGWGRNGHVEVTARWFSKAVTDIYADKIQMVGA